MLLKNEEAHPGGTEKIPSNEKEPSIEDGVGYSHTMNKLLALEVNEMPASRETHLQTRTSSEMKE